MNIQNIVSIKNIIIKLKTCVYPFNPVFFMLLILKSFEILPKHNGYGFIFESFALNLHIFTILTETKLCTIFFLIV